MSSWAKRGGTPLLDTAAAPSRVAGRHGRPRPLLALLPAAALVALVYVLPMARLVVSSLWVNDRFSLLRYAELVNSPVFWIILLRTFRLAAIVTALTLAIGYPLAYVMNKMEQRFTGPVMLTVTLPFFTNLLIWAYAWVVILGNNGLINHLLTALGLTKTPLRLVFNEFGVIVGMVQIQLPLMVLPLYSVMRRINRSIVLAAQSLGATPLEAFWTVFRPLSTPGVAAGLSLVFVTSLGFYITPALLGGPGQYVITQSIDTHVETRPDFGTAATEATILLGLVGVLLIALQRSLSMSFQGADEQQDSPVPRGPRLSSRADAVLRSVPRVVLETVSAVRGPALAIFFGFMLVYLVLPLIVVVPTAFSSAPYLTFPPPGFSLQWFQEYFGDPDWISSTWFSLTIAILSATLATLIGVLAAFPLVRARMRASGLVYLAFLSPIIIPQMVPAVAIFFLVAPIGLTGTLFVFVLVYTVITLPYVIVVTTAALRRFDVSLERAAASLGASPVRVLLTVTLPLIRPAVITAFLFAFLTAWNEVVFALFLGGPGAVTLPIRMWENIRMEISPRISAVSVLSLAIALLAVTLPVLARRGRGGVRAVLPQA